MKASSGIEECAFSRSALTRLYTAISASWRSVRRLFDDRATGGNETPHSFWRRLNERTLSEMRIYDRTKRELENEKSSEVWEQKNEAPRTLGLRTIPLPEER